MATEAQSSQRAAIARFLADHYPAPIDALNLLSLAPDPRPYFRYGRLVFPLALAYSARWLICAKHVESITGPVTADEFVVCRYKTHRHFFRMVLNPYYRLINKVRSAGGLRHFEVGLSHQHAGPDPIVRLTGRNRRLVIVQFADRGDGRSYAELVKVLADLPGHPIYASRLVTSIEALGSEGPKAAYDPHPLTFPEHLVWQITDFHQARAFFADGVAVRAMVGVTRALSIDLYWRVPLVEMAKMGAVELPDGRVDLAARAGGAFRT